MSTTKRSKSVAAAEAIAADVEAETWQRDEVSAGLTELDSGKMLEHEKVSKWLRSWGKPTEGRSPR